MYWQWLDAGWTRRLLATLVVLMSLAAVTVGAHVAFGAGSPIVTDAGCTANTLPANDDESTGPVDIGFPVNFFGQTYDQLFVNNNGNVTFGGPLGEYTPFGLTGDVDTPIIAPFFADVDTTGGSDGTLPNDYRPHDETPTPDPTDSSGAVASNPVTYGTTTYDGHHAFCVDWIGVGYYSGNTDKLDNFQLLLVDQATSDDATDPTSGDFDIVFNYGSMQWETGDSSGGSDGLGGECAAAGYSNGQSDETTGGHNVSTELPGSHVCGALIDGGPDALNGSRYTFQARAGAPPVASPTPTESATSTPTPTDSESATSTPTPTNSDTGTPTPIQTTTSPSLLPVALTNLTAVDDGGTVTLGARLVLADTSTGVPCEPLLFTVTSDQSSAHPREVAVAPVCTQSHRRAQAVAHDDPSPDTTQTAVTDSNGFAQTTLPLTSRAEALRVDFGGDNQYTPATYSVGSIGSILSGPNDGGQPPPVGPSPTPTPTVTPTVTPTATPTTPSATPSTRPTTATPTPSHTATRPTSKATKPVPSTHPTHTAVLGLSTTRPGATDGPGGGGPTASATPTTAGVPVGATNRPSPTRTHHALGALPVPLTSLTPPPSAAQPTPKPTPKPASQTAGDSRFGRALGDVRQLDFSPEKVGENAAIVLAATLIVLFPSELLNKTLHENYEEISGWFAPVTRRLRRRRKENRPRSAWRTALSAVTFLGAASLVYGIGQPDFGLNAESLRVVLGLAIGLALISIGGNHAAIAFARHRYHAEGQHALRHGTLLVAIACVLISRATHFEPGYTYGLVAGFVLDRQLGKRREARAVLSLSAYLLGIALIGWLLLAPSRSWLEHSEGFWPDLAVDVCTALTVEGLTGLVLALLPIRFMEGERLVKASKLLWAGAYGLVLFVFLQLVVNPSFVHRSQDPVPLVTWLSMCVGFGVVSVAFWGYFWRRHRGEEDEAASGSPAVALAGGPGGVIDLTDGAAMPHPGAPSQRRPPDDVLHPSNTD